MKFPHLGTAAVIIACATCAVSRAQEEPDRPAGEVTAEMLKKVPPSWVGAGGEAGAATSPHMRATSTSLIPFVLPAPQEVHGDDQRFDLGPRASRGYRIELAGEAGRLPLLRTELAQRLERRIGAKPRDDGRLRIVFALSAWHLPVNGEHIARQLATLEQEEGYVISSVASPDADYVLVLGKSERALWRALATIPQLFITGEQQVQFPIVEIVDYPHMRQRALLTDIGGQGFMVGPAAWEFDRWKQFVDWMVDHKLNELWLEIIGSGRLMGNLDMEKGEWIGFPIDLRSFPQLVARDRPIRRWSEEKQQVVEERYTAPNVRAEFMPELIDYAKARGIKCVLFVGYDYFANQLPYVLGVPANDPAHPEANKVYDTILREIVERYRNADGVVLHTIENKNVPPSMVDEVVRRMHEGRAIVKSINPAMDVGVLNDYLEWRPREEFERYSAGLPQDMYQVYSPHTSPQNKSWKRIHGDVFRYELFTQYAWDHIAYIFPDRVAREIREDYINGYRKVISQAWYFDVFSLNFMTLAEMSWNATGRPVETYWDAALTRVFGAEAVPALRTAFAHTRFDLRHDIVSRMILRDDVTRPFNFWDMYKLTNLPGLRDEMLAELETDARTSLAAAQTALPLVKEPAARELVEISITSAERRLYLATSARHLLAALAAERKGNRAEAAKAIGACVAEGRKLVRAATRLGIEYPMAVHDDEIMAKYLEIEKRIGGSH